MKKKTYYWKGKLVSEKVYNHRKKLQDLLPVAKSKLKEKKGNLPRGAVVKKKFVRIEGRRIANLEHLFEQLQCSKCYASTSLKHCVKEHKNGVASIFSVECQTCYSIDQVYSDTKHSHAGVGKSRFDCNTKLVIG